jgi:hypothetical protein
MLEFRNIKDNNLSEMAEVTPADLDIGYLYFLYMSEEPVSDEAAILEFRIRNTMLLERWNLPENTKKQLE